MTINKAKTTKDIEQLESNIRKALIAQKQLLSQEEKNYRYRHNPIAWLEERFGEDRKSVVWSEFSDLMYSKHQWDGTKDPFKAMWEHVANGEWVAVTSGTGTGKTYTLSRLVLWYLDCYPQKALVITTAPKEDQLAKQVWKEIRHVFDKFKRIRPNAELLKSLQLTVNGLDNQSSMAVGFVAGVEAGAESTKKAQGFHAPYMLIIMEETTGIPTPTINALVGTCEGDNNIVLAVGNPDSELDGLGNLISTYQEVNHVTISALDHPNVVLDRIMIQGAASKRGIARKLEKEGGNEDGFMFYSRVRGRIPKGGSDSLISYAYIKQCIVNANEVSLDEIDLDFTSNACGVDPAKSLNGDNAAVSYGKSNALVELIEFKCPEASDIAYNLKYGSGGLLEAREKHSLANPIKDYNIPKLKDYNIASVNVGVDVVGLGASTIETMHKIGIMATSLQGAANIDMIPKDENGEGEGEPLYLFKSLRAQMYWEAMIDLRDRKVFIYLKDMDMVRKLTRELTVVRYTTSDRYIIIESKDKIKKRLGFSPNLADAFVYWNWVRKLGHQQGESFVVPFV